MLYMSRHKAKLATLESQKEAVVCTTHLWNAKKGEKGWLRRRNQHDRDRHAAESAQQRVDGRCKVYLP